MNWDDIIPFIVIIIFVVGPLLKKIGEALGGQDNTRKNVKKYLEEMRSGSGTGGSSYRAPATKSSYQYKRKTKDDDPWDDGILIEDDSLESSVADSDYSASPYDEVKEEINVFEKNIMKNENFSDFQKAIIITEVFGRPKSLD